MSKIAIIGPAHPYRGGIAAYNERLAEHLQKNHAVQLYTFTLQYPSFLFPGKTQYTDAPKPKELNIVRCINAINPLNWISTGRKIKKENYDIVIVRYWLPFLAPALGTIMRIVKKNRSTKTLAIVDNMIPHEKRIGDRAFSNYFVNSVDYFLAMTEQVANDIQTFDSKKPRIISPHPLYDHFGAITDRKIALEKLALNPEYNYLLFFGLIRDYKGLDLLLEAFSKIDYQSKKLKLIIAGEYYSNKDKYTQLIKDLGIEHQVIQHDYFIPDDQVANYFNAATVVVQPYKTATQSGITQIAYHFNKPMIVTNVGGLPEMCPDGKVGYVVNPDVNEIASAITKFFDDTDINLMQQHIIEEKTKYSWDILVKNIFKLIN